MSQLGRSPFLSSSRARWQRDYLPMVRDLCLRFDGPPHRWRARYETLLNGGARVESMSTVGTDLRGGASVVKVVFIASLSHSGSTLLDLMLNAHPEVASVGELKQLGRFARLEKPNRRLRCTCGAEQSLDL